MSYPSVCSILDIPDEILVMIILHFDASERLALGNSCQRFNDLVFGDEKLLRNLNFTGERRPTEESDIQQYFNDKNTYKKILGINTENLRAASSLSSLISKAMNLVELNILNGLRFESVEQLSRFLKPLVHLKRLSVDWPVPSMRASYHNPKWNQVLKEPFSRLTYLSLKIERFTNQFLLILQLCQQLEKLCMSISGNGNDYGRPLRQEPIKLSNLKFVRLIAAKGSGLLRKHIMYIVPDPAEWTDFYLADPHKEIYLERNVEVCPELSQLKDMPLPQYAQLCRQINLIDKGWALIPEHLLSEVIGLTHEDVPEKFCCFAWCPYLGIQPLLPDEAKKLLKDPRHRITYLNISHAIERNCDVHLLASAFPNLTTLVLSAITNRYSAKKTESFCRRLGMKGSVTSEEDRNARNMDSSFKMLVENTPKLKVLEISPGYAKNDLKKWDLNALNLISGWKHLTVIRLYGIPIRNGKFLVDIGKECTELEELTLCYLISNKNNGYESELMQMLQQCRNLRKFSSRGMCLGCLSDMFNMLSNCSRLTALRLETFVDECDALELTLSVEKMLRQCQELNEFLTDIRPDETRDKLRFAVETIISEMIRPNFQFGSFQFDCEAFIVPFPS